MLLPILVVHKCHCTEGKQYLNVPVEPTRLAANSEGTPCLTREPEGEGMIERRVAVRREPIYQARGVSL